MYLGFLERTEFYIVSLQLSLHVHNNVQRLNSKDVSLAHPECNSY